MSNVIFRSAGVIAWLVGSLACSVDPGASAAASDEPSRAELGQLQSGLGVDGGVDAGDAGDAGDLVDAAP